MGPTKLSLYKELHLPIINDAYIRISSVNHKLDLIQAASKGELRAVADASYTGTLNLTTSAAAWILESKSKIFSWEGSGIFKSK